ncbi:MAG: diguanylate cyclase [Candidatus Electrothrix sp. GW3-4]|uniref:GGDEF domain-containing protein n=1 Tax=Candidatus Electrothrix sp. GW3-4 TaxID=3126740 RepID=UPI0030D2B4EB
MNRKTAERIAKELNITPEDFERRKEFLGIGPEDIRRIKAFRALIPELPVDLFDAFYQHLLEFDDLQIYFKDKETVQRLKEKQLAHFEQLFSGEYDQEYMLSRLHVGYTHVALNIEPLWYIGAFNKYLQEIKRLVDAYAEDKSETFQSITKMIMLEIVITMESYHYTKYKLQEELKQIAITDDLTGVFNRRKLEDVMCYEMDLAQRKKHALSILMLDIDHFKQVNDTYGHQAGDAVLVETARLIQHCLRTSDYVIRYGGEEFLACLPKTSLQAAADIADRLRRQIAEQTFSAVGRITVSIGIAEYTYGENREAYIRRADEQLYAAKQGGRNRVCWETA